MITSAFLETKAVYTGLLLGFAISIVIALIGMKDKRRIVTATIVVFALAAFLLFVDTYSSVRLLIQLSRLPDPLPAEALLRLQQASQSVDNFDTLGFFSVILGVGLSGWIHSKLLGVLTTLGMMATFVFVFRFVAILVL